MKRIGMLLMAAVLSMAGGARADDVFFGARSENMSLAIAHRELDTHGTWAYHENYGRVWCPAVAIHDYKWRPYCDGGRWIWSPDGWYWQSDYEWGRVAFHYGRWVFANPMGWVWVPGYEWAPAWVVWRESESYCGWAPMPPEVDTTVSFGVSFGDDDTSFDVSFGLGAGHYVFVQETEFLSCSLPTYVVPVEQCRPIYRETHWRYQHDLDRHYDHRERYQEEPRQWDRHPGPGTETPPPQQVQPPPPPQPASPGSASSMRSNGRLSRVMNSSTSARSSSSTQRTSQSSGSSSGGRTSRMTSSSTANTSARLPVQATPSTQTAQPQKQAVKRDNGSSGDTQPTSRGSRIRDMYADRRGR